MATRMQQRRGTAQQWTDADPILAAGEIGFETDTNQFKIGDGVNNWSDLSYFKNLEDLGGSLDDYILLTQKGANGGVATLDSNGHIPVAQLANLIDGSPQNLDTLKEIADTIALHNSHVSATTQVHGIPDTADLVYTSGLTTTLADYVAQASLTTQLGDYVTTADLTQNLSDNYEAKADLETDVAVFIATHNSDQTDVHGISNTANLVYTSDARLSDERTPSAGSVTAAKLATDAVETAKIANNAVTNAKLADDAVDTAEIKDGAVTNAKLAGSIDQSKITNLQTDLSNKQDKVTGVSDTEIGYLDGVTSSIQDQLDDKAPLASPTFTGTTTTGDLVINGDVTVNSGEFLTSATSIVIDDNMVQLAHANSANTVDLGLVVAYNDGAAKHSGVVRDVSANKWKIFKGVTDEPSTTVNFTQGSLDDLEVYALTADTVTPTNGVIFSDGTQTKEGVPSRTPIISKTESYTLSSLTERDSLIEVDSSSSVTITIPTNSAVAFPVGTTLDILGVNTGLITIAGDTGVTVNATPGLKLRAQWSSCTLFKRATNSWVVYGDLKA